MENKERILLKADELYYRYAIWSVSMDDIDGQLGMSKKTLYQYYADKDELVNAVFSGIMDHNKKECTGCRSNGENAIHEVFLSFDMLEGMLSEMNPSILFDMQKYHPSAFRKFEDYRNNFLYGLIRENIERGIKEELYRSDVDVEILTRYRLFSIMISFDSDVFPANKTKLVYIEQQLLEHYLWGLATNKGQKLIQKYKNQRTKK